MSEPKNHQNLLAKLIVSTLLLLLLAGTFRYSSNAFNTDVQIVYEVAPQPGLEPAPGKVALPFGNKDGFQAIAYYNTTYSSVEASLLADATKLQERAFNWDEALAVGEKYIGILNGPRTQDSWSTMEQLQFPGGGWIVEDPTRDISTQDIEHVYNALGIHRSDGQDIETRLSNTYSNCRHHDITKKGEGGVFGNVFNAPGRAIIGIFNYGPGYWLKEWAEADNMDAVGKPDEPNGGIPLKELLPRLSKWSDIVWILWAHVAGASAGQLKYVLKHFVVTDETVDVMDEVAKRVGIYKDLSWERNWPGLRSDRGTDDFKALVGTPHGKGIVHLLVNHVDMFPTKDIESITIFTTNDDDMIIPHMLFTLTDKP